MTPRSSHASETSRFIALLRAINVGGRTVRMETLRKAFGAMGFTAVETFIASGNVIFGAAARSDSAALERRIEEGLAATLGFEVATFVRSPAELQAVAVFEPFARGELDRPGASLYVGFLHAAPSAAAREKVLAQRTDVDDLHLHGKELHWLARRKMSDSRISGASLERALGMPMTMRNITTVRKLAAKYPATS